MYRAFLIKYGEIGIKGKNRRVFEEALMERIREALSKIEGGFEVTAERGRVYVGASSDFDYQDAVDALKRVFGIVWICPVVRREKGSPQKLAADVTDYIRNVYPDCDRTFKIQTRRADKSFPLDSQQTNAFLGDAVLSSFPDMKVDVHDPDILLRVEIRSEVNIYSEDIPGPGGMPVGTGGKAMLLLSGGIDSPVAGYLMAKRGVVIEAVYFHAPPYTSERAKQKVKDLAKIISRYCGPIRLNIVNFTDIQLYIYDKCPHDELTIIMRRYMMRIAEHFARESKCLGLVTGESIGQVASQTMQSLAATNEVCTLPVYRPLITYDKNDIIAVSEQIGTYETSIQPFEDCCTIFVAKHPVTKPNVNVIGRSERRLSEKIDEMVQTAVDTAETILIDECL